jgi:hypothetical protein
MRELRAQATVQEDRRSRALKKAKKKEPKCLSCAQIGFGSQRALKAIVPHRRV